MPDTKSTATIRPARPDQAAGFQHIGAPANALIARLNATQNPNVVKMHDAIDRWVKEANRLGGEAGIEYLARAAARIEMNRLNLEAYVADREPLVRQMEGVTVTDLIAADGRINRAVRILGGEPA